MKRYLLLFTIACFFSSLFSSCESSKQTASTSTPKPKFISNVYIAPHYNPGATVDAIDHKKYPQKAKSVAARPQPAIVKAATPSPAPKNAAVAVTEPAQAPTNLPNSIKKKYAELLGVQPKEISNSILYRFIDKWIGADYRMGGCDISGIDCSGFAQRLYSEVYGVDLLRTSKEQFSECKRIKNPKEAAEGDLVFFHVRSKRISHVGIYLANDYFVHASTTGGVMISNINEDYWRKTYAGCGRIPRG